MAKDTEYEGSTLVGGFCLALSVPLYLGGLDLLSSSGSTVYENVAKKAAGLFCLGVAAYADLLALKIARGDHKIWKKR
jgi:hypothetical protein